jgi:hypothetical protein
MKMALVTVLTVIAFLGSLAVADAQSGVHSGAKMSETDPKASIGWNYVHATNCLTYFDGSLTWLYVLPQEGGNWFTNDPAFERTIGPACQTGNWLGFFVYSTTPVLWNAVVTFTFK